MRVAVFTVRNIQTAGCLRFANGIGSARKSNLDNGFRHKGRRFTNGIGSAKKSGQADAVDAAS